MPLIHFPNKDIAVFKIYKKKYLHALELSLVLVLNINYNLTSEKLRILINLKRTIHEKKNSKQIPHSLGIIITLVSCKSSPYIGCLLYKFHFPVKFVFSPPLTNPTVRPCIWCKSVIVPLICSSHTCWTRLWHSSRYIVFSSILKARKTKFNIAKFRSNLSFSLLF